MSVELNVGEEGDVMIEKRKYMCIFVFFFKQKTAYDVESRDWSSDVCSSDLESIT